jgi:hypothetical protein
LRVIDALGRAPYGRPQLLRQAPQLCSKFRAQRAGVRRNQFGRGRRRGRPQVRDEVGNRHVAVVADADDDRQRRRANRARHHFLVERPQVLNRTTAANQQQDVNLVPSRRALEHRRDLATRSGALNRNRIDDDTQVRRPPLQYAEHVAECRRLQRGHTPTDRGIRGSGRRGQSKSPSAASRCLSFRNSS